MAKITIIDDEPAMLEIIVTLCRERGHQVSPFNSAAKTVEKLDEIEPQIVITDVKMETMSGFDSAPAREGTSPADAGDPDHRVCVGRHRDRGDEDGRARLRAEAVQDRRAADDGAAGARLPIHDARELDLRKELKNKYKFENVVGSSPQMQTVYNLINKVADTDSTVLIQGESGTAIAWN